MTGQTLFRCTRLEHTYPFFPGYAESPAMLQGRQRRMALGSRFRTAGQALMMARRPH